MMRAVADPTLADLARARAVVAAHLAPTPLVEIELPDGRPAWLKLDSLQPGGSFKIRGALAAVSAYAAAGAPMITASAGNHGLGFAHAARRLGVAATVVVARTASPAKLEALRRLGVDLIVHGDSYDDAERHALALADGGRVFVSAYNDPHVIAGQATWAAEVAEQLGGERALIVPIGGGGLLAATVLAADGSRVVGVEAAASPAFSTAIARGAIVEVPVAPTLADGLAGNLEAGTITPRLVAGRAEIASVTEAEIADAMRFLALRCGLVVEGSGAVGVAALLSGRVAVAPPARPIVLITGRNVAAATLGAVLAAPSPGMSARDVLGLVDLLGEHGIAVWLDGGWGVDALLGRQTRPHGDLDIAVRHGDVPRLRAALAARGYEERSRPDTSPWNFVLADALGHEIDVHSFVFDEKGDHVAGIDYPAASLTGTGTIDGRPVACIAAEYVVQFRSTYEPRERDYEDVFALHERFGIALPEVYARRYRKS